MLSAAKIPFEALEYTVDENDLSGVHIAEQIGYPLEQVFKTLVLRGDKNGLLVCVIPGDKEVDLKKAAKISGNKKVEMIAMKELLPLTGYIRGGCTPIGMKKPYPTWSHYTATNFPFIYISAGQRGLQLKLNPDDLMHTFGIVSADLIAE